MDFERNILASALYQSNSNGSTKIYNELLCVYNQLLDYETGTGRSTGRFKYSGSLSPQAIAFYQTIKFM